MYSLKRNFKSTLCWIIFTFVMIAVFFKFFPVKIRFQDAILQQRRLTKKAVLNMSNSWSTFELVPDSAFWIYNYTFGAVCNRDLNNEISILIIGYTDKKSPFFKLVDTRLDCYIRYEEGVDIRAAKMELDVYFSTSYSSTYCWCKIFKDKKILDVSLTLRNNALNERKSIKVDNIKTCIERTDVAKTKQKKLGLCIEYLYNMSSGRSLAEFVELHRLIGVSKAIMHGYGNVSDQVLQLINYYKKIGFLEFLPWNTDSLNVSSTAQRFFKSNCMMRYYGKVDYMLYNDVDEVIIPSSENLPESLPGLIEYVQKRHSTDDICSLFFYWSTFCVPDSYVHHRTGTSLFTSDNLLRYQTLSKGVMIGKSIINVNKAYTITGHEAVRCRGGSNIKVSPLVAKVHHYRYQPKRKMKGGECNITDTGVRRYQKQLQERVTMVMRDILCL